MNEVEQKKLLQIVVTWNITTIPHYRAFRCGVCQQYINEAWHHLLTTGGYKTPVHLCEQCEADLHKSDFRIEKPFIDSTSVSPVYTKEAIAWFNQIVEMWQGSEPLFKAFTCDDCGNELEIDTADGMRKGWHAWWRMDEGTLAELHFHESCGMFLKKK